MNALRAEVAGFGAALRDGFLTWKLAPAIPLIAAVPELVQHCVEITLGMFGSLESFRAFSMDPTRMTLGGIKMAGLVLAVLMAARFWANRAAGDRWWSLAGIGWKQVLIGLAVQVVLTIPGLADYRADPAGQMALSAALTVLSLPGLVLMIGGIVGDRDTGLVDAYTRGWGKAFRIALYVIPPWAVLAQIHYWAHMAALGRPTAIVWSLMVWDALVVGLIATMAGTALHHGYMKGRGGTAS